MKQILLSVTAFVLCLAIVVTGISTVSTEVFANTENTLEYEPDRIYNFKTYYSKLKDYNTAYKHNKEVWKAQRTDADALEKYAKDYIMDKDLIDLAKKITKSSKDDYAKMKAIYKWVAENIYYDKPAYRNETYAYDENGDFASASPVVVYERKRAVCGGYTSLTVALFRAIGIPAKSISGPVKTDSRVGHAWTQAWLESENRWVILDTTWGSANKYDDGVYTKGKMNYTYFDISLKNLSKSHIMMKTSELWNRVWWHPNVKGEVNTYTTVKYNSGLTWKKPPENPGHGFGGWFKDADFKTKWDFDKDKASTDVHLYAKWTKKQYTVTFNSNGGSAVSSVTVEYGERLPKPKNPTRKGYIFGGWSYYKDKASYWNFDRAPSIATVKEDRTLYAIWQKPYTITFDSCGGIAVPSGETGYNGVVQQPSVTPEKEGYTFAGWYYKANAKASDRPVYFGQITVKKDTTFYARWTPGSSKPSTSKVTPTVTPTIRPTDSLITQTPVSEVTPDLTAAELESGIYNIKSANSSNLSIDVPKSSLTSGITLIYYRSTANDNQKFILNKVDKYKYTITAVHSGKNWNSPNFLGGYIKQEDANGDKLQIFTIMKYSDGYYRIKDCNDLFVGASSKKAVSNTNVLLWSEASDMGQEFILTQLSTDTTSVITPTPAVKPTPTPTVKPTPTPTPTPEEPIMEPYTKSITVATDTNSKTIKEGWYYFICKNNFITVNNTKAILTKDTYANMLYIKPMGGKSYSIRSMYSTYLTTEDTKPVNGDNILAENLPESGIITGWIIEIVSGNNIVNIRPLNNKNLVVSAENGNIVMTSKASNAVNAQIMLIPRE